MGSWATQLEHWIDHPVICSWDEANNYIRWLAKLTKLACRLPTEAEWEKAARWDQPHRRSRIYPWGDVFDESRRPILDTRLEWNSTAVGTCPSGTSPCGAQDMVGNVREWTSSLFKPYPYNPTDGRERPDATEPRVVRGGDYLTTYFIPGGPWQGGKVCARAAYRDRASLLCN